MKEELKELKELKEAIETIVAAQTRVKVLRDLAVNYNLSVPLEVRLTYDISIMLPEEVAVLERVSRRVKKVTVCLERGLVLLLEGEDGREWALRLTTLGDLYVIAAVWEQLRQQGIDFMADLVREVERMVKEMELLRNRFKRAVVLLQVGV